MILKNWHKIFAMNLTGKNTTAVNMSGAEKGVYKTGNYYGTVFDLVNSVYSFRLNNVTTQSAGVSGVMFGTGTTPVTIDDYKLSGSIITGLTPSISESVGADENGAYRTVIYTLTNTNSYDVTIGEVGAVIMCCESTSTMASSRYPALVERTVLDKPITIPAGGFGQVTYTVRFNYPTA